jgi:hypothetical protein
MRGLATLCLLATAILLAGCADDEAEDRADGAGASGGTGGAGGTGGSAGHTIDAGQSGSAGASCEMLGFDGGQGSSHDVDAGCNCPDLFRDKPHGTACSVPLDCSRCYDGTCWADCVRCTADAAPRWWATCTE